jgi:GNAT superfamily N-acetyltransferase
MIEVVAIDAEELQRVVAVHNRVHQDDPTTIEELLEWRRQAEDMGWFVAVDEGEDAGAGLALVGWHLPPQTGIAEAWTLPDARGRGIGAALYAELLRWSAERGCIAVQTAVAEDDEASLAWADRRGFREIGRNSRLVLDLDRVEAPPLDPPAGIEIATWAQRPGIEHGLYDVMVEAAPDIPGEEQSELPSFDAWLSNDMQGLSDRPEAVFVAFHADEVVGYGKLSLPHKWTGDAFHDLIGVKRAWRGLGIAGALKRAQIAWAKEQGYRRLVTQNEERNEPIRRLNRGHGYHIEPGRVFLRTAIGAAD